MNSQEIREAAGKAASVIIDDPPMPNVVITRAEVLLAGEVADPPKMMTQKQARERAFLELQFFDEWRRLISLALGRYPKTVYGEGFRLLGSGEVSGEATADAFRKATLALLKASWIVKNVRAEELTAEERRRRLDDQARLGWARQALAAAQKASISSPPPASSKTAWNQSIPTATPIEKK